MTTTYVKTLLARIEEKYGDLSHSEFVSKLIDTGVVDFRLCRILAIREWVNADVKAGATKYQSMWHASKYFGCTYEYVRKCMYYYTDINFK